MLSNIKHVVLDMDGTIYKGGTLFPWTIPFLDGLARKNIGYTFLTNNPSKSSEAYLKHLRKIGITAAPEQLYTTTQATIDYIKRKHPSFRRLFMLGTPGMIGQFVKAGFEDASDSADDKPDALIVAFDMTLVYSRLCRASWWAKQGIPYIATNPDRVCPTDLPTVLVDCGSICAAIEHATGRAPDITLGKPDPAMLEGILRRHKLRADEIAMVGDRLYTDIRMAERAGAAGVLVLSGEATADDVAKSTVKPTIVVPTLAELGELLNNP
jgi:NagD protein